MAWTQNCQVVRLYYDVLTQYYWGCFIALFVSIILYISPMGLPLKDPPPPDIYWHPSIPPSHVRPLSRGEDNLRHRIVAMLYASETIADMTIFCVKKRNKYFLSQISSNLCDIVTTWKPFSILKYEKCGVCFLDENRKKVLSPYVNSLTKFRKHWPRSFQNSTPTMVKADVLKYNLNFLIFL